MATLQMVILKKGALSTGTFSKIYDAVDFFKRKFGTDPHSMFLTQDFCDSACIKTQLDLKVPVICASLPTYLSNRGYCYLEYKTKGSGKLTVKFT